MKKAGDVVAIVPAGGAGRRMSARLPKQYVRLGGVPLLVRTLRALAAAPVVGGIVVAAPRERVVATRRLLAAHRVGKIRAVVEGGAERQESVWLGLQAAGSPEWVLVHDAVRPFITPALVVRVLAAAAGTGAATCGLAVRETVKRVREAVPPGGEPAPPGGEPVVHETLDRAGLWLIQTPQAFRRELLWEAHDKARRDGYAGTDDAVLVERLGGRVAVVPGLPENLKITTPGDLRVARLWTARPVRRPRPARPRR
ncbi:MAG TPA: 2-C-methyl-D-erythritol 4-phosphate cytidylyltransferase [Methylomirabilota bacterium]|nr:2-C-methyl-D-erythritol 4-phosphate cytidylyltransferase [Methylomirabilota bacterium]